MRRSRRYMYIAALRRSATTRIQSSYVRTNTHIKLQIWAKCDDVYVSLIDNLAWDAAKVIETNRNEEQPQILERFFRSRFCETTKSWSQELTSVGLAHARYHAVSRGMAICLVVGIDRYERDSQILKTATSCKFVLYEIFWEVAIWTNLFVAGLREYHYSIAGHCFKYSMYYRLHGFPSRSQLNYRLRRALSPVVSTLWDLTLVSIFRRASTDIKIAMMIVYVPMMMKHQLTGLK